MHISTETIMPRLSNIHHGQKTRGRRHGPINIAMSDAADLLLEVADSLDPGLLASRMTGFDLRADNRCLLKWTTAKSVCLTAKTVKNECSSLGSIGLQQPPPTASAPSSSSLSHTHTGIFGLGALTQQKSSSEGVIKRVHRTLSNPGTADTSLSTHTHTQSHTTTHAHARIHTRTQSCTHHGTAPHTRSFGRSSISIFHSQSAHTLNTLITNTLHSESLCNFPLHPFSRRGSVTSAASMTSQGQGELLEHDLLPLYYEFATEYDQKHIKYSNVELFLFNDMIMITKKAKKLVALSVPLYFKSLVITKCEASVHHDDYKFKLLFGDCQYVVKVGSKEERDDWIAQTIGAMEWLDTVASYSWTLSAPVSRNAQTREANIPFTRVQPMGDDEDAHDLLGLDTMSSPIETVETGRAEKVADDTAALGPDNRLALELDKKLQIVQQERETTKKDSIAEHTEKKEKEKEKEESEGEGQREGTSPSPPRTSCVYVVAPPDEQTSISRSRSNSTTNRATSIHGEDQSQAGNYDDGRNALLMTVAGEDAMIFQEIDENGRKYPFILAGTLEKLVERLADEYPYSHDYVNTFLMTYRSLLKPMNLLDMLIGRFNCLPRSSGKEDLAFYVRWKKPIQTKVLKVLVTWITDYWVDFATDSPLYDRLMEFVPEMESSGFLISSQMIYKAIEKQTVLYKQYLQEGPYFFNPPSTPVDESLFNYYSEKDIAEQITLFDSQLFQHIHVRQFLNHIWSSKDQPRKVHSPYIDAFCERFNHGSYWVATRVCLLGGDMKAQSRVIAKFVNIAKIFLSLQNYYGAFSIMGGLRFPPVRSLKCAWAMVPPKTMAIITEFEKTFMNPARNMKIYRDAVEHPGETPTLPFLPIALKDLVFINDGNDKLLKGTSMFNFDKLRMIAKVCSTLESHKSPTYPIKVKLDVLNYVRGTYVCYDLDYLGSLSTKPSVMGA